jgi:hypothetical protein
MRPTTATAWLLPLSLCACESKVGSDLGQRDVKPSANATAHSAPHEGAPARAKGCLSAAERNALSLQRTWWSAAGLGYCVGATGPDRCIELQVLSNAFVPLAAVPVEARSLRPVEHPLLRTVWSVKSGIKVCDPQRVGQLDQCAIIETQGATPEGTTPDSDDSSALATQQRLLTADISADRGHVAFANKDNRLVVQTLKPRGADRFVVKTRYTLALGEHPTRQLWWVGNRVVLKQCAGMACTLAIVDPLNAKATAASTNIAIGRSLAPLHTIGETDFVVVGETGEQVYFFDMATGSLSRELTLPRRSAEGVWAGKSAPFELAVVYGKPNLGDIVRVHLQRRIVSTVNTAGCE